MKLDAATLEPIWVKTIMTSGGGSGVFSITQIEGITVDGNGDLVLRGFVNSGKFHVASDGLLTERARERRRDAQQAVSSSSP
eukprot:evm.model.NODE_27767_length_34854_cov_44.621506.2